MSQRSSDGEEIREGFYLDQFRKLVHVREKGDSFEYRADPIHEIYEPLQDYTARHFLGRIRDPIEALDFLRLVIPTVPEKPSTPRRIMSPRRVAQRPPKRTDGDDYDLNARNFAEQHGMRF